VAARFAAGVQRALRPQAGDHPLSTERTAEQRAPRRLVVPHPDAVARRLSIQTPLCIVSITDNDAQGGFDP
jgi:hypothetical protein